MKSFILSLIPLYIFWTILSERFTLESMSIGLIVSVLILAYNRKILKEKKPSSLKKIPLFTNFILILLKEIFISNLQVAKIVLSKNLNIEPQIFRYKTKLKTDRYRAVFANAITLTPGTITLSVRDDIFTVHGLRRENIEGVVNSDLEKILIKMEEV